MCQAFSFKISDDEKWTDVSTIGQLRNIAVAQGIEDLSIFLDNQYRVGDINSREDYSDEDCLCPFNLKPLLAEIVWRNFQQMNKITIDAVT